MRDVTRVKPFIEKLEQLWTQRFPDWRFGQLMFNFMQEFGDPFYWEEDEFLKYFQIFCDRHGQSLN